ncbi:MAG: DUF805 domain-containing protein [Sphingomicrobium sp.]
MTPIDWATRPLKKYADFTGRAPRPEYWWFYLMFLIIYIVAMIVDSMIGSALVGPYGILTLLVFLAFIIPTLSAGVRRLHDSDRTGWWMLAPMIPYGIAFALIGPSMGNPAMMGGAGLGAAGILMLVGVIVAITVLVFLILPGTKGPNRFGEDPHGVAAPIATA